MIGSAQAQSYYEMDSYGSSDYRDDNKRYDSYGSPDYGMDNNYQKSYGNDNGYDSQYQSYKSDYKPQYPSYGKDKDDRDKSKDSSKNVDIKKIKCNNININLNAGTGTTTNGNTTNENGDNGNKTDGFKKIERDGFTFICINNNNNVGGGGGAADGDNGDNGNGDLTPCEECWRDGTNNNGLGATLFAQLQDFFETGGEVDLVLTENGGTFQATVTSLEEICDLDEINDFNMGQWNQIVAQVLAEAGITPPPGNNIAQCLDALISGMGGGGG
jgi:hypothetical protein